MNVRLPSACVAISAVAAFALSASLLAQTPGPATEMQPSQTVRYADLELSSSAGIHTLYRRIQNAAWRVCLELTPPHIGPRAIENNKCRHILVDLAVAEVNRPALTALHAGQKQDERTAGR